MLKGRLVEQQADLLLRRLAVQGLVEQTFGLGAEGIGQRAAAAGGLGGHGAVRQLGKQQAQAQQHCIGHPGEALAQLAKYQLDIPGFQGGAPVQIEGKTAGDVDRLPDDQDQHIQQVGQVFQPQPLAGGGIHQAGPAPVQLDLLRQQQVEQGGQADPQRHLQVHADQGQPAGTAGIALAKHGQPLVARLAGQAFELQHRQVEAARGAQAAPGQAGQQLRLEQAGQGLECLFETGGGAEQGMGEDIQRQPFVEWLEPPEQQDRPARVLPQQQAQQAEQRQGQQRPAGHQQAGVAARQQYTQVHRLPGAARANRHAGISQAHGHLVRPAAGRPAPAATGPRLPGI